jgi:hypothetical protein
LRPGLKAQSVSPRLKFVTYFLYALVSVGFVNLCGFFGFTLTDIRPVEIQAHEQLALPAVMPYDVWVMEPWGGVTARVLLAALLLLSVLFLFLYARNLAVFTREAQATAADSSVLLTVHRRAFWMLVIFWMLSCVLLVTVWKVLEAASHGLPPNG